MQKKKPSTDKKKRKVVSEKKTAGSAGAAVSSKPAVSGVVAKSKSDKAAAEVASENIVTRSIEFLREVKVELNKVTWPTRKQTTGTTIVVILFVFVVAAFLGLFDYGLSKLVQVVLT